MGRRTNSDYPSQSCLPSKKEPTEATRVTDIDIKLLFQLQGEGTRMPFEVIALALYALAGWSVYLAMAAVRTK